MRLKANLHFHTGDDPIDNIPYSFEEGIDSAALAGFEVMALTCHKKRVWSKEYEWYAAERNILLIPGVERDIEKKHVVILNPDERVEELSTWNELRAYKQAHPEIFVIAPHPYYYGNFSLNGSLEPNIDIFDAIEHSWFYSERFNRNLRAEQTAQRHKKPFIATSDTHDLRFLETSYAIIETKRKTIPDIFEAIREKSFRNITFPQRFPEMIKFIVRQETRNRLG